MSFAPSVLRGSLWTCTCPVSEREDHAAIGDPAHIPDRGDAAVVGVVLRTQVLQLQNLRFPLQLRPNQHWYANVCENTTGIFRRTEQSD